MGPAAVPIMVASTVGGGLMGMYGAHVQGKAAELQGEASMAAAQANASIARNNAALAAQQMQYEREAAFLKARAIGREAAKVRGAGKAAYAAGNVQVGSGSALSWERSVSALATEDLAALGRQTEMKIAALQTQRQDYLTQAAYGLAQGGYAQQAAGYAQQAATISGLGSLLGMGSQLGTFFAMRKT